MGLPCADAKCSQKRIPLPADAVSVQHFMEKAWLRLHAPVLAKAGTARVGSYNGEGIQPLGGGLLHGERGFFLVIHRVVSSAVLLGCL